MARTIYPALRCEECGEAARMIAVCQKPGEDIETRFYECSNPVCRESFKSCVPVLRSQEWIGLRDDFEPPENSAH